MTNYWIVHFMMLSELPREKKEIENISSFPLEPGIWWRWIQCRRDWKASVLFEEEHENLVFWGNGNSITWREEPRYVQRYRDFPFFQPSVNLTSHVFPISLATKTLLSPLSPNWEAAAQHHFMTIALILLLHSVLAQASLKRTNNLCFGFW